MSLTLKGTLVASRIQSGNRKDDGAPYCLIISSISTGQTIVNYTESVDPVTNPKPHPLNKEVMIHNITRANTNAGMITVNGEIKESK
jgi:hypothetical protein